MRVLIALVAFLGYALAYDLAGVYERMWFWYAYQLDLATNGGHAGNIGTGCGKYMNKKTGAPCSFNQFIQYINENKNLNFDITTEVEPRVQPTADRLYANGISGPYIMNCVSERISGGTGQISVLFATVREFCATAITEDGVSNQLKQRLRQATLGAARARMGARCEKLGKSLVKKKMTLVTKQVPVYRGATDTAEAPDLGATAQANGKTTGEMEQIIKDTLGEDAHDANIDNLRAVVGEISRACAGP